MKYPGYWSIALCVMVVGSVVPPSRVHAQQRAGLEVVLSCPAYWPGPPARGNDPAQGAVAQAEIVSYLAGDEITCQVYYSHTGATALQDVAFELELPSRALQVWVSDAQKLPDGNPLEAARGVAGVFSGRDVLADAVVWDNGIVPGSYDSFSQRYVWAAGELLPGSSGQFGVKMRALGGPVAVEVLRLHVSHAQGIVSSPREVSVQYTGGAATYGATGVAPLYVDAAVGRAGAKHVWRRSSEGRRQADVVLTVDLPYWDGAGVRADGGYDAMNAQHIPLVTAGALVASVVMDGDTQVGRLVQGASVGPATGANAGKIIRHNTTTQQIEVQLGSPGEVVEVMWSAALPVQLNLPPGATIPHRSCWRGASVPRTCALVATSTISPETPLTPRVAYQGISYSPQGAVLNNGVTESSALSSRVARLTQRVDASNPSSVASHNYEVIMQAPGDTESRAAFLGASWGTLYNEAFGSATTQAIYVSVVPSGYGEYASLSSRAMPAARANDWVRCDHALGAPSGSCTEAHLVALGIDGAQVEEVRFFASHWPARHESPVEPGSVARTSEWLDVTWKLSASVRDSIDGTVGYDPDVLVGRSVGGLTLVRHDGALSPVGGSAWRVPRSAEVSSQQVDALPGISGAGANSWSAPLATIVPGQNGYVGVRLYNNGAQTNIFGPFELRMTLPAGFDPDSARFFPVDTLQPRVRVGRTNGQGGTTWTWNDTQRISSSYSFDPQTREYIVRIETRHPQGGLVPIRDVGQGVPSANEVGDLIMLIHGDLLVGAPNLVEFLDATLTLDLVEGGARRRKTLPLMQTAFDLSSRKPALRVSVQAPERIAGSQRFDYLVELHNAAYDEQGALDPAGATGPASGVVLYQPITRAGDHPLVERGRASSIFQSAYADEARAIWVSTSTTPQKPLASQLAATPGWVLCATLAQRCDVARLGALGVTPAQVRWLAFEYGEVLLTDVEPRGREVRRGIAREERTYTMSVSVREDLSNQDAVIRMIADVVSAESPAQRAAPVDVSVDASCDTRRPFVGFDQAERCDGVDNNCNGEIDETFGLGGECVVSFEGCVVQGVQVCNATGAQICDVSALANQDGDPYPDVCDCAPRDATRFDMLPWTDTTCDYDGDGDCNVAIAGLNPQICARGVMDCDDYNPLRNSWARELCDDQDNDCDGAIDEDFQGLGARCEVGEGSCARTGELFCGGDALSVECDALPGAPAAEACDGLDNDCDGVIDEDFQTLGQPCEVGLGMCTRQGQQICALDGRTVECDASPGPAQAERCNALDDDCDGDIDEDFVVGPGCVVEFPGGCTAYGVGVCDEEMLSARCVLDLPQDSDGDLFPDVCDCAPYDASLNSMERGGTSSCDVDGDGWCDARIEQPNPEVCVQQGDCNDALARIYPGAFELCNGVDEDCDGDIDEGFDALGDVCAAGLDACRNEGAQVCTPDGLGVMCSAVAGVVGAVEVCDGSDNNCDGEVDEGFAMLGAACEHDIEGCVMSGEVVCAPSGGEVMCGVNEPQDFDEDGVPDVCDCAPYRRDRASTLPGVEGSCDGDGDGWCEGALRELNVARCPQRGDCDDREITVHPGARELCNDVDEDCDGDIDEDFLVRGESCELGGGVCATQGVWTCDEAGESLVCEGSAREPTVELCNGIDDDCDGDIDEDFSMRGEPCAAGSGACAAQGMWRCDAAGGVVCEVDDVQRTPTVELCNGVDDDCDGDIDEGFEMPDEPCVVGEGACAVQGAWRCDAQGDVVCEPEGSSVEEVCNGVDDDCDGEVDEQLEGCEEEHALPPDYAVYGTGFCGVSAPPGGAGGSPQPWLLWLAMSALMAGSARRRAALMKRCVACVACVAVCLVSVEVLAQQTERVEGALSTQQFRPMPGGAAESTGAVAGARLLPHGELSVGVWTHYGYRPLVLVNRTTGESMDVLRHQVQSELMMGMGVGRWFEVGMALPVIWQQSGAQEVPGGSVASRGVGDLRVSVRGGKKRVARRGLSLSGGLTLSLPTGSEQAWQSDAGVGVEPGGLLTWGGSRGSVSANLGVAFRGSEGVLNAAGGEAVRWGVGGVTQLWREELEGYVELFGSAALQELSARDISDFPAEAMGGVRLWVAREHLLSVGAGPGLTRGYGTPTMRFVAGYRFVPARDDQDLSPHGDEDHDGVLNRDDACLGLAEDFDGFEDEDGCPDWDNDRDELLDDVDGCPDSPEDRDGFEDEDGCPDEDNDRDGVPDVRDLCANVPEDIDGFEDEDGCPELDNDYDGLNDLVDECVMDAEDFDGFEDEDGCPDEDNDRDGVPDVEDRCPEEQEIFNGFEDEDGCPDEVSGELVAWTRERILLGEEIYFDTDRAKIQTRSRPVLKELAMFLLAHPEIELIEIQGHTDDKGSQAWNMDLSWRRAENVRKYLMRKGVAPERMVLMGYGKVRPLQYGETEEIRARNRRVEFRIRRFRQAKQP